MKIETALKVSAGLVVVVMSLVATIPYLLEVRVQSAMADLTVVGQRERDFLALRNLLRDAETGQLGYVVAGKEEYLRPYYAALDLLPVAIGELRGKTLNDAERASFKQLERAIEVRLASLEQTVRTRRERGFDAAQALVSTYAGGSDKAQIETLRTLTAQQVASNAERRKELRQLAINSARFAAHLGLAATLANIAALAATLLAANSALRRRHQAERSARNAAEALELSVQLTSVRNEQLAGGTELMHALDLAESVDESSIIISRYFGRLLPKLSGSLYLYRNSRDILERKAQWGAEKDDCGTLELLDCWGLRKGGQHFAEGEHALQCRHCDQSHVASPRLCLPLVAQGDVIGCITVVGQELSGEVGAQRKQWIVQLAEQVALALSNVQLRLKLRQQSVIDPLTELYNRRYMDEVLKREQLRANRRQSPLSVILLDLDHFKRVNDTYGHDTGDLLLRKVGEVLRNSIRAVDVACRFGGEELVVILPDCDLAAAVQRAEAIRAAVAGIDIRAKGQLVTVTASIGVATSSGQSDEADALMRCADAALYTAKQSGRNRVVSALSTEAPNGVTAAAERLESPQPRQAEQAES
ncbi:diguanylate cyclase [Rugamonas sp. CCM 8940]|uniref:diguanylate cyclase n=1 Tax=Rugamonas sp. CCM 8940 TaxID=2765359 RepID=UPI0018F371BA|nr:diguanylate cyclase [Rugamonas sp. CCM 8940]MBJ7312525.1 diguanylate cyclase [Rugamonas sp. CCM 8940]